MLPVGLRFVHEGRAVCRAAIKIFGRGLPIIRYWQRFIRMGRFSEDKKERRDMSSSVYWELSTGHREDKAHQDNYRRHQRHNHNQNNYYQNRSNNHNQNRSRRAGYDAGRRQERNHWTNQTQNKHTHRYPSVPDQRPSQKRNHMHRKEDEALRTRMANLESKCDTLSKTLASVKNTMENVENRIQALVAELRSGNQPK